MPFAGNIESQPPAVSPTPHFTAVFLVGNGEVVTFKGTGAISMLAFRGTANLTYGNRQQLTGQHSFNGTLGAGSFSITLSDTPPTPGVTIDGTVAGGPPQSIAFTGSGSWAEVS